MAVKAKTGATGTDYVPSNAKKTNQGNGRNSRPSHGRKLKRGQG